jgi:cell shape-determining protein MreD
MKTASYGIVGFLFVIVLLLEGVVTTVPLVLIFLLSYTIIKQDETVFLLALLAGIVLDLLTLRLVGVTTFFYIIFLLTILLYDKKYEIHSLPFMAVSSFVGSFLYLLVFVRKDIFLQSIVAAFLSVIVFLIYTVLKKSKRAQEYGIV